MKMLEFVQNRIRMIVRIGIYREGVCVYRTFC
jgi:hypothetical protein